MLLICTFLWPSPRGKHSATRERQYIYLEGTKGVPRNGGRRRKLAWLRFALNSSYVRTSCWPVFKPLPWDPLSCPQNLRYVSGPGNPTPELRYGTRPHVYYINTYIYTSLSLYIYIYIYNIVLWYIYNNNNNNNNNHSNSYEYYHHYY